MISENLHLSWPSSGLCYGSILHNIRCLVRNYYRLFQQKVPKLLINIFDGLRTSYKWTVIQAWIYSVAVINQLHWISSVCCSSWSFGQMEKSVWVIPRPLDGWGREAIHVLYLHSVLGIQHFDGEWGAGHNWGFGARKHHTGTLALSATIRNPRRAFGHRVPVQDCIWAGTHI